MRTLWALIRRCWAIDRARYRVHCLEDEHDYHRVNLNFHAEQCAKLHRAVLDARREVNCLSQEPDYLPSVHQMNGSRR